MLLSRAFAQKMKPKRGWERSLEEEVGQLEAELGSMKPHEKWGGGRRVRSWGREKRIRDLRQLELEPAPNRISVSDLLIIYPLAATFLTNK